MTARVDKLRQQHRAHIDELRRLEGCGLYLCDRLESLADKLEAHRKLVAAKQGLPAACSELGRKRSLYVAYALKPKKLTPVKRQDDPARDRVVDCRLVLDGERILRTQIVATATWQARIGSDFIHAAVRYKKQGRISAHLARRIASIGRERRRFRDRLQPIFERTGVKVPDHELFEALGEAVHGFEEAVAARRDTTWSVPVVDDKRFGKQVRTLFVAQARLDGVAYASIDGIGVVAGTWQKYHDAAGRVVRRTRRAEIALKTDGSELCVYRDVVVYRHDRGRSKSRKTGLWIGDDVRFGVCPSRSAGTPAKAADTRSTRKPRG